MWIGLVGSLIVINIAGYARPLYVGNKWDRKYRLIKPLKVKSESSETERYFKYTLMLNKKRY